MTDRTPFPTIWRKSSHSGSTGGDCVEVAALDQRIAVRDSKSADGPVLAFAPGAWRTFTHSIKTGHLGRP